MKYVGILALVLCFIKPTSLHAEGHGLKAWVDAAEKHSNEVKVEREKLRKEYEEHQSLWKQCNEKPEQCRCGIEMKEYAQKEDANLIKSKENQIKDINDAIQREIEYQADRRQELEQAKEITSIKSLAKLYGQSQGRIEILNHQKSLLAKEQTELEEKIKKSKEEVAKVKETQKNIKLASDNIESVKKNVTEIGTATKAVFGQKASEAKEVLKSAGNVLQRSFSDATKAAISSPVVNTLKTKVKKAYEKSGEIAYKVATETPNRVLAATSAIQQASSQVKDLPKGYTEVKKGSYRFTDNNGNTWETSDPWDYSKSSNLSKLKYVYRNPENGKEEVWEYAATSQQNSVGDTSYYFGPKGDPTKSGIAWHMDGSISTVPNFGSIFSK